MSPTALFFLPPQEPILSHDGPPSILKQTFAQQWRNTFLWSQILCHENIVRIRAKQSLKRTFIVIWTSKLESFRCPLGPVWVTIVDYINSSFLIVRTEIIDETDSDGVLRILGWCCPTLSCLDNGALWWLAENNSDVYSVWYIDRWCWGVNWSICLIFEKHHGNGESTYTFTTILKKNGDDLNLVDLRDIMTIFFTSLWFQGQEVIQWICAHKGNVVPESNC